MSNSADWNCTYAYYHDGQRVIEIRNGSDQAIKQQVWGMQYVDELLQVGLNPSPTSGNTCLTIWGRCGEPHPTRDARRKPALQYARPEEHG